MSNFLSKIKSLFVVREEKSLEQFFSEYIKIRAEIVVSDIKVTGQELNFKVAWRGNVVPFWVSSEYQIADVTSMIATGLTIGLNLVEISEALKKSSNLIQ